VEAGAEKERGENEQAGSKNRREKKRSTDLGSRKKAASEASGSAGRNPLTT